MESVYAPGRWSNCRARRLTGTRVAPKPTLERGKRPPMTVAVSAKLCLGARLSAVLAYCRSSSCAWAADSSSLGSSPMT